MKKLRIMTVILGSVIAIHVAANALLPEISDEDQEKVERRVRHFLKTGPGITWEDVQRCNADLMGPDGRQRVDVSITKTEICAMMRASYFEGVARKRFEEQQAAFRRDHPFRARYQDFLEQHSGVDRKHKVVAFGFMGVGLWMLSHVGHR